MMTPDYLKDVPPLSLPADYAIVLSRCRLRGAIPKSPNPNCNDAAC
jgi:hypothetical protein